MNKVIIPIIFVLLLVPVVSSQVFAQSEPETDAPEFNIIELEAVPSYHQYKPAIFYQGFDENDEPINDYYWQYIKIEKPDAPFPIPNEIQLMTGDNLFYTLLDDGTTISVLNKDPDAEHFSFNKNSCIVSLENDLGEHVVDEHWLVYSAEWLSDAWIPMPVNGETCTSQVFNDSSGVYINTIKENDLGIFAVSYIYTHGGLESTISYHNNDESTQGTIDEDDNILTGTPYKFGFTQVVNDLDIVGVDGFVSYTELGDTLETNSYYYTFKDSKEKLWGIYNADDFTYFDFKYAKEPINVGEVLSIDPVWMSQYNLPSSIVYGRTMAFDSSNDLWTNDYSGGNIFYQLDSSTGNVLSSFNSLRHLKGGVEAQGSYIYGSAYSDNGIKKWSQSGGGYYNVVNQYRAYDFDFMSTGGVCWLDYTGSHGQCNGGTSYSVGSYPQSLAVNHASNNDVWITDNNSVLWKFPINSNNGVQVATGISNGVSLIDMDSTGTVYYLNKGTGEVDVYSAGGTYQSSFGSIGSGAGQWASPDFLKVDNNDDIWIADYISSGNNIFYKFGTPPPAVPSAPANLEATQTTLSPSDVNLTWDTINATPTLTGYKVYEIVPSIVLPYTTESTSIGSSISSSSKVTKTVGNGWDNNSWRSDESFTVGQGAFAVEWNTGNINTFVGFNKGTTGAYTGSTSNTIDSMIYTSNGAFTVWEGANGQPYQDTGAGATSASHLKIEVDNNGIATYYLDGVAQYTSTIALSGTYYVNAQMYYANGHVQFFNTSIHSLISSPTTNSYTVTNVADGEVITYAVGGVNSLGVGATSAYPIETYSTPNQVVNVSDQGAGSPLIIDWDDATVDGIAGLVPTWNSPYGWYGFAGFQCNTVFGECTDIMGNGWNNYAYSDQTVNPATGGGTIEWTRNADLHIMGFGQGTQSISSSENNADFGIYAQYNDLRVYEQGGQEFVASNALAYPIDPNDVFKITMDGNGLVEYYLNDVKFYTSAVTASGDYYADLTINSNGGSAQAHFLEAGTLPSPIVSSYDIVRDSQLLDTIDRATTSASLSVSDYSLFAQARSGSSAEVVASPTNDFWVISSGTYAKNMGAQFDLSSMSGVTITGADFDGNTRAMATSGASCEAVPMNNSPQSYLVSNQGQAMYSDIQGQSTKYIDNSAICTGTNGNHHTFSDTFNSNGVTAIQNAIDGNGEFYFGLKYTGTTGGDRGFYGAMYVTPTITVYYDTPDPNATLPSTYTDSTAVGSVIYEISATNTVGTGMASAPHSATAVSQANAPTNFSGTPNAQAKPELTWTPSSDLGFGTLLSMQVERIVTGSGGGWNTVATTSNTSPPYIDTTVNLGTSYDYRIASVNEAGIGVYSATITVVAGVPPDVPTNLTSVINNPNPSPLTISLDWDAPQYTGTGNLSGYEIYRNGSWIHTTAGTPPVSVYTDIVSTAGSYTYEIKTVTNHGTSGLSGSTSVTTPTVPDADSSVTLAINNPNPNPLDITVSFVAPSSDGGSAVTGYNLSSSPDDITYTSVPTAQGVTADQTITVANAGTWYFKSEAINNVGVSTLGVAVSIATPTVPDVPTVTLAINNPNPNPLDVQVVITPPTSNGGSAITNYDVYRSPDGNAPWTQIQTGTTVLSFTNVVPNAGTWYYTASANNNVGSSAVSSTVTITTPTVPPAPASASSDIPDRDNAPFDVVITWTVPPTSGGSAILNYNIYRTDVGFLDNVNALTFNDTLPSSASTNFTYHIHAVNNVGEGAFRDTVITTSGVPTPPVITVASGSTVVEWTAPSNGGSAITGYEVYRDNTGVASLLTITSASATSFHDISPVTFGTQYVYSVKALNNIGSSGWSNPVGTTPILEVDDLVVVVANGNSIRIGWSEPAYYQGNLSHYSIFQDGVWLTNVVTNSYDAVGLTPSDYEVVPNIVNTYDFHVLVYSPYASPSGSSNVITGTTAQDTGTISFDPLDHRTTEHPEGWIDLSATNQERISDTKYVKTILQNGQTQLDVKYPSNWSTLTCELDYKYAGEQVQYTDGSTMTSYTSGMPAGQRAVVFLFTDAENEVISVTCADPTVDGSKSFYVITQNNFPLLQQIELFKTGEFGTDGSFGAVDLVSLFAVLITMVGFNRVHPLAGVIIGVAMMSILSAFGIIQFGTAIGGIVIVLILIAIGTHKRYG